MECEMSFGEVLEVVDRLSLEEKEILMEILHRRVVEQRRKELAREIKEADAEFKEGHCKPATPDDLMADILS